MDSKRILRFSSVLVVVICASMCATDLMAVNATPTKFVLQQPQKFIAKLTGQDEVPAKNTTAKGIFEIELTPGGRVSSYVVNVTNISNVTLVHIHQGVKGTNGPVVVTLYKSVNGSGQMNGKLLLKGRIFGKQFVGPLAGRYISDLIQLIKQGQIYVNVHTKQNPQGEIRGQLLKVKSTG